MTDQDPNLDTGSGPPDGEGEGQFESLPLGTRAASVRLSDRSGSSRSASDSVLMDPAHQSLADALRITLRIVQASMLVLVVFFLFSGARTIREGESGVRLVFGRVQAEDLPPGFQFSWPFPIGDLLKVETGNQRLTIAASFWPQVDPQGRPVPADELNLSNGLDPAQAGSLITADGNLVHTTWSVTYRRLPERASFYVRNVDPESEEQIVRAAVRRGVVHAVAEEEIEQVLKAGGSGELSRRARAFAQSLLDRFESGIAIESLDLDSVTPPAVVRDEFDGVLSAESEASQLRDDAESEAEQLLLATTGRVYPELLEAIEERFRPAADEYQIAVNAFLAHLADRGVDSDEQAERAARLADEYETLHAERTVAETRGDDQLAMTIAQRMQTVRENLERVAPGAGELLDIRARLWLDRESAMAEIHEVLQRPGVGGEVARLINEARLYAETEGRRRQADLETYRARLEQFRRNPLVTIHSDWSDALETFMGGDHVQAMLLPPGTSIGEYVINKDPVVTKRQERAAKERELERTIEERERRRRMSRYETDTTTRELDAR